MLSSRAFASVEGLEQCGVAGLVVEGERPLLLLEGFVSLSTFVCTYGGNQSSMAARLVLILNTVRSALLTSTRTKRTTTRALDWIALDSIGCELQEMLAKVIVAVTAATVFRANAVCE